MRSIEVGDIVQSKKHKNWKGEVIKIHEKGFGFLVSWYANPTGHIRTWAYIDDVILHEKVAVSRYEKAILDRKE
tara:strand:- start:223 stop:444 length:222 start_codon:yes stop_codon:yes gene_type:complete